MKQFASFIATIIILCSGFIVLNYFIPIIPASIASASADDTDETVEPPVSITVRAFYEHLEDPNIYKSPIEKGKASITTKDGTILEITTGLDIFDSGVLLVVRQILSDEKEAFHWFKQVMKAISPEIMPLEIYFIKDGKRVEPNGNFKILVTIPDKYTEPRVYQVTTKGNTKELASVIDAGQISFNINHSGYYVLTGLLPETPKTGDSSSILIYIVMNIMILGVIGFFGDVSRVHIINHRK